MGLGAAPHRAVHPPLGVNRRDGEGLLCMAGRPVAKNSDRRFGERGLTVSPEPQQGPGGVVGDVIRGIVEPSRQSRCGLGRAEVTKGTRRDRAQRATRGVRRPARR